MLSYESKEKLREIFKEENPEGFVVAPCPNCQSEAVIMEPSIGGSDYHPQRGGSRIGYKKGYAECPNCGEEASPTLSVVKS